MNRIKSKLMFLCFGRESLKGYYKPSHKTHKTSNYVFCSVFPNEIADNSLLENERDRKESSFGKNTDLK